MIDIYENIENSVYEVKKRRPYSKDFKSRGDYQTEMREYQEECNDLYKKFRADLAEYNGMTGHPKEEKVYNMASDWANGASRRELADRYEELADLVK